MNCLPAPRLSGLLLISAVLSGFSLSHLPAGDWPTYLRDNSRVGMTPEQLAFPLSPQWSISPPTKPVQAWPGPNGRVFEGKKLSRRNTFDDAFHVAVVGQRLYYGSSVDHEVRCLDLNSGKTIWDFFTEAAVRLSPTVFNGKVYVGSDDGYVYCLRADDGTLLWKMRPGPADERILGRQHLISRWPVRTGIAVAPDS